MSCVRLNKERPRCPVAGQGGSTGTDVNVSARWTHHGGLAALPGRGIDALGGGSSGESGHAGDVVCTKLQEGGGWEKDRW